MGAITTQASFCSYLSLVSIARNKKLSTCLVQNIMQMFLCLISWGSSTAAHLCIHSSLDKVLFFFFSMRKKKGSGSWMQVTRGVDTWGKKCLAIECYGLAMSWDSPYYWHIPMCGYIHIFTETDSVRLYGKFSLQCLCSWYKTLSSCLSPVYLVITVSHSTLLYCPHPHSHRAIQKR